MKILKLPWLSHRAENKTLECYALDINRAGTKLASGGLDGKVKIWDLPSILNFKEDPKTSPSEADKLEQRMDLLSGLGSASTAADTLQRPLASMSRHNGVVTSVKFSPDGRFLASGSDDKIVLIWEKDDELAPRPKQFGEAEADLEHWTVRKRLVAHDNDVQDICWSPDGGLLITVGLDRSIIIWNGATFERIKRYDIHQSMVKGVVFDPANKFFATASDDRSVRIFRYYKKFSDMSAANYEFQMEQVILDPFKKSPLTSYFRRMSWSPDGQHIAVPNATNGPVTSVVIINRGNWATDVSLIGHEAPCEVCAFSPKMFENAAKSHEKKDSGKNDNHTTILASGGQDRTLALWSTALTKPLAVLQDIVQKAITDITWAPDGQSLFVSSLDGLITCLVFEPNELGVPVSADAIGSLLERYGGDRDALIMAESVDQLKLEKLSKSSGVEKAIKFAANATMNAAASAPASIAPVANSAVLASPALSNYLHFSPQIQTFLPKRAALLPSVTNSPKGKKPVHNAVVIKGGKKRVAPTLISTYSGNLGTSSSRGPAPVSAGTPPVSRLFKISKLSQTLYALPKFGVQTAVHGRKAVSETPVGVSSIDADADNDNEDMGFDDPNSTQMQTLSAAGIRIKTKKFRKQLMAKKYPTPFKMISDLPEALFCNQAIMNTDISGLVQTDKVPLDAELVNIASIDSVDEGIYFRVIVNTTTHVTQKYPLGHPLGEPVSPKLSTKGRTLRSKRAKVEVDDTEVQETPAAGEVARSIIEVRNGPSWPDDEEILNTDPIQRIDFQDPTQVIVTNSHTQDKRSYVLYFPFKIQHAVPVVILDVLQFYVLISFDGVVQIIRANTGSYFFPSFELGSNVICTRQKGCYFMVLTSLGQVFSWEFSTEASGIRFKKLLSGVSVACVVNAEVRLPCPDTPGDTDKSGKALKEAKGDAKNENLSVMLDIISAFELNEADGMPIVVMERTHTAYTYSRDLMVWTKTLDPWYLLAYDKSEISRLPAKINRGVFTVVADAKYEKVQKGDAQSYRFQETNQELKLCMRSRFEELLMM